VRAGDLCEGGGGSCWGCRLRNAACCTPAWEAVVIDIRRRGKLCVFVAGGAVATGVIGS
jgi:hypothetical protein